LIFFFFFKDEKEKIEAIASCLESSFVYDLESLFSFNSFQKFYENFTITNPDERLEETIKNEISEIFELQDAFRSKKRIKKTQQSQSSDESDLEWDIGSLEELLDDEMKNENPIANDAKEPTVNNFKRDEYSLPDLFLLIGKDENIQLPLIGTTQYIVLHDTLSNIISPTKKIWKTTTKRMYKLAADTTGEKSLSILRDNGFIAPSYRVTTIPRPIPEYGKIDLKLLSAVFDCWRKKGVPENTPIEACVDEMMAQPRVCYDKTNQMLVGLEKHYHVLPEQVSELVHQLKSETISALKPVKLITVVFLTPVYITSRMTTIPSIPIAFLTDSSRTLNPWMEKTFVPTISMNCNYVGMCCDNTKSFRKIVYSTYVLQNGKVSNFILPGFPINHDKEKPINFEDHFHVSRNLNNNFTNLKRIIFVGRMPIIITPIMLLYEEEKLASFFRRHVEFEDKTCQERVKLFTLSSFIVEVRKFPLSNPLSCLLFFFRLWWKGLHSKNISMEDRIEGFFCFLHFVDVYNRKCDKGREYFFTKDTIEAFDNVCFSFFYLLQKFRDSYKAPFFPFMCNEARAENFFAKIRSHLKNNNSPDVKSIFNISFNIIEDILDGSEFKLRSKSKNLQSDIQSFETEFFETCKPEKLPSDEKLRTIMNNAEAKTAQFIEVNLPEVSKISNYYSIQNCYDAEKCVEEILGSKRSFPKVLKPWTFFSLEEKVNQKLSCRSSINQDVNLAFNVMEKKLDKTRWGRYIQVSELLRSNNLRWKFVPNNVLLFNTKAKLLVQLRKMGMSKNEKKKHYFYANAADDDEARNTNYEGLFVNLKIVTEAPDVLVITSGFSWVSLSSIANVAVVLPRKSSQTMHFVVKLENEISPEVSNKRKSIKEFKQAQTVAEIFKCRPDLLKFDTSTTTD